MFTTLGHLSQFDPQAQEQIHEDNGRSEKNGDKSKSLKRDVQLDKKCNHRKCVHISKRSTS